MKDQIFYGLKVARPGMLLLAGLFLFSFIAGNAGATPPSPEVRAGYLLPDLGILNDSIRSGLTVTSGPVPAFPDLSPYYARQDIMYGKTNEHYPVEIWFFASWNGFAQERAHLLDYLAPNGTLSATTVDLAGEQSALSAMPEKTRHQIHQIPALRYQSNQTTGYFVMFRVDNLPGDNYYIAYYGATGPDPRDGNESIIRALIMSSVPGILEGQTYDFSPSVPPADRRSFLSPAIFLSPPVLVPVAVFAAVLGIFILLFVRKRQD